MKNYIAPSKERKDRLLYLCMGDKKEAKLFYILHDLCETDEERTAIRAEIKAYQDSKDAESDHFADKEWSPSIFGLSVDVAAFG